MKPSLLDAKILLGAPVAVEHTVKDARAVLLSDLNRSVVAAVIHHDDLIGENTTPETGVYVALLVAREQNNGYAFLHTGLPGSLNLTEI